MESEKKGNKGLSFVSQNITFVLYVQHLSCDKWKKSVWGILKLSVSFISVRILFMIRHQNWKVRARVKLIPVKVISLTWYKLYMKVIKDIPALAPKN